MRKRSSKVSNCGLGCGDHFRVGKPRTPTRHQIRSLPAIKFAHKAGGRHWSRQGRGCSGSAAVVVRKRHQRRDHHNVTCREHRWVSDDVTHLRRGESGSSCGLIRDSAQSGLSRVVGRLLRRRFRWVRRTLVDDVACPVKLRLGCSRHLVCCVTGSGASVS